MESINEAYLQLLASDPNTCVALGFGSNLNNLPDPSLEEVARIRQAAVKLQQDATELAGTLSDFHEQLDMRLIALSAGQHTLRSSLRFNDRLQVQQLPKAGEEISSGIFYLITNDPRPAAQRLENILARLQQIPSYLEKMLSRLDTPVARWVKVDLETIAGLPDFFETILQWAEEEGFSHKDQLGAAIDNANSAMADYAETLSRLPTTHSFAVGHEQAQALVSSNGIDLTLAQIHQIACDFVTRTRQQIEELRETLVAKHALAGTTTASELQTFLERQHAVQVTDGKLEHVIERYQSIAKELEIFVKERSLFPIPDQQTMKIMQTPAFMAPMIPAGAMMPPPAMRDGVRTSMVYLTLSPELLKEHTELGIPLMMVHEGIPGHHLQLSTAAMHPSVIRRTFSANEHAEGWTTMLEDYMLDQNLMGDLTDEARFVTKLDLSRIGARVAIDLYFMTGDLSYLNIGYELEFNHEDPFANAAKLLIAATGFSAGRAQAELNWYSQERAYPLSYLVGNHLVWQLKEDFQRATAETMTPDEQDRSFHRIYLESGNMPVAYLRKVFEYELQRSLLSTPTLLPS
ncbi:conserved hypothetical protein [gamma proteobacterium NOR5-3]|nr:conserved hypothetical protein [gamma proteobacterium NOR5-3]